MTSAQPAGRWIRHLRPAQEPVVRLLCFPHAGGAAGFFQPLARRLPPAVDVHSVQYPGRQDRSAEPPVDDIGELADRVCDALPATTGPALAFLGHSMGAVVAFEVAHRLVAAGRPAPELLIASSQPAPSHTRSDRLHLLDDLFLADVAAFGGADPALLADPLIRQLVLPALRADYRAIETYRHRARRPPLAIPVTAVTGDADPLVTAVEARAWADHTTGAFRLETIRRGDHFYLRDFLDEAAALVSTALEAAGSGRRGILT